MGVTRTVPEATDRDPEPASDDRSSEASEEPEPERREETPPPPPPPPVGECLRALSYRRSLCPQSSGSPQPEWSQRPAGTFRLSVL